MHADDQQAIAILWPPHQEPYIGNGLVSDLTGLLFKVLD